MRQIVLDTETTGLEVERGHRIIEIGCVELLNRRPTAATSTATSIPSATSRRARIAVHGITRERLPTEPRFAEVAEELLRFIDGSELIIHNAAFDVAFLEWNSRCWQMRRSRWLRSVRSCVACSIRCCSRASATRASATASMRCASVTASTIRIGSCTARCSMHASWQTCTWR